MYYEECPSCTDGTCPHCRGHRIIPSSGSNRAQVIWAKTFQILLIIITLGAIFVAAVKKF